MLFGIPMDDHHVNNTIAEFEAWLATDDPSFVRRLRRIRCGHLARSAAVFAALTMSALLLAGGLAFASAIMWFAGAASLLTAFAVAPHRDPIVAESPQVLGRRVDQWNEIVPIAAAWSTAIGELRGAEGLDPWCPTLRRISLNDGRDTGVIGIGRHRSVSLRTSHRWFAEGIRWQADAGGPHIVGHVTLQPTLTGVQVWVHAEAPRCRHSRRALRTIRRETRIALRRWAATHDIGSRPRA